MTEKQSTYTQIAELLNRRGSVARQLGKHLSRTIARKGAAALDFYGRRPFSTVQILGGLQRFSTRPQRCFAGAILIPSGRKHLASRMLLHGF